LAPEIHFNIWEREPAWQERLRSWGVRVGDWFAGKKSKQPDDASLDIGIMFDVNEAATSLELIFPTKVPISSVLDLSSTISDPKAVPAVFNESWAVAWMATQGSDAVVYDPANLITNFAIVDTATAISETTHGGHDALSIQLAPLIAKARAVATFHGRTVERVYVRFRILNVQRDFYAVGAGSQKRDSWWMPSWQKTEDIDFRLNVRRGAPPGLEMAVGRFVEFSKVHLFVMRSRDKDIVFHDKLFKASRSLEDEAFWAQYSLTGPQTSRTLQENLRRVRSSLGYHWKKSADPDLIREFGTLARFKIVEFGVGKFLVLALLLGAAGNGLWDGVKLVWEKSRSEKAQLSAPDTRSEKEQPVSTQDGKKTTTPGQAGTKRETK
jgi:hypothetical protein